MAGGLNFSEPKELERWLSDKPAEWAQIIAWRAAMRAVPALGRLKSVRIGAQASTQLSLAIYRCLLVSAVACKWPAEDIKAAARTAAATSATAVAANFARTAAPAAARVVAAAVGAARAAAVVAAAVAAARAAAAAAAAASAAAAPVWPEMSADVTFLSDGKKPDELALTPLWPQGQSEDLTALWRAHKDANLDFAPWFEWYEAAAKGEPFGYFSEKLSRKIALQSDDWWGRGPEAVNADIKAWVQEQPQPQDTSSVEKPKDNPADLLPHFSTDDNMRLDDRLGVANDARIFARLLAATDTSLPLAVGLFGPWGGGKSFFMKLMRREMAGLKGRKGFHGEIAHIEFNAWHYVDADLWASLGLRIFEGVAEHLGGKEESDIAKKHRELKTALKSNTRIEEEAKAAIKAAQEARSKAQAELAEKRAARLEKAREILINNLLTVEFNDKLKRMAAATGLSEPKDLAALEEALIQARRVAEGWGKFAPGWLLCLPSLARYLVLIVAALAVAWALPQWASFQQLLLDYIKVQVEPLTAAMPAAAAWGIWLNRRLATVRDLPGKLEGVVKQARAAYAAEPENGLAALDAEIAALRIKADNAAAEIEAAAESLRRADSGMLLYDHLTERAKDGRYVDRQGVVAVLRRDLEHLKDYLGALNHDTAKISRIVLYIDDLDRCEPGRVVEVLQAVHLLLAFPLFAVVVAVDPRWLERSLYDKYLPDHRKLTDEQLAEEDFSPRNYLEKIFQIPFRLDPKLNGFKAMVDGLTAGMVEIPAEPVATGRNETSPSPVEQRAVNTGKPGETPPESAASPDLAAEPATDKAERSQEPVKPPLDKLKLTPAEVEALKQVHPFIPTPRALKRMLNVYLLVRLRDGGAADNPIAVMTLLGLEIGFPAAGRELLRAIRDQRDYEDRPLLILAKDKLQASPERDRLIDALTQAAPDVTVERARPWLAAAFRFSFDPPEDPGPTPGPTPAPTPAPIPVENPMT